LSPAGEQKLRLVLGGYSYGSHITTRLPDLTTIFKSLKDAGSAQAALEIADKSKLLASQTRTDLMSAQRSRHLSIPMESPNRASFDHVLSVGSCDETPASPTLKPHHSVKKSIDDISRRISIRLKRHSRDIDEDEIPRPVDKPQLPELDATLFELSYVLVSPLLPPVSTLTTLPFFSSSTGDHEQKFREHPSLAVFGGRDMFTSAKKVRAWCSTIAEVNSKFRWVEISEASHFWHEDGVAKRLNRAVKEWIAEIETANP
jgi:pimeloyl-ACP methyl ester carboxylesterase